MTRKNLRVIHIRLLTLWEGVWTAITKLAVSLCWDRLAESAYDRVEALAIEIHELCRGYDYL